MAIVEGDEEAVVSAIKLLTSRAKVAGKRVAVIASDETQARYRGNSRSESGAPQHGAAHSEADASCCGDNADEFAADVVLSMGSRADEDSIARHLYHILRECDELGVDEIYSESFSTPRIGNAIMNRLLKAAGHQVLQAEDIE